MSQSHDFEVRDFHENMTDLTAATSNIKDLNGVTAALIRFAVRDPLFSFDTNIGILKEEKETGEVLLYVPQGTKRITIRHPQLGILRDYQIPVPIKAKTTYDAEIVITDTEYFQNIKESARPQMNSNEKTDKKVTSSKRASGLLRSHNDLAMPRNQRFKYKYEGVVFECWVKKDYITIIGFNVNASSVIIPSQVEVRGKMYPVTEISTYLIENNYKAEKIVIQEGIQRIDKNSFREFRSLKDVTLPTSIREIGKNAFRINKDMTFHLPSQISESDLRSGQIIKR